uniref:Serine/arginine repetitive matrix 4 n=1 Tax=Poecilia reticulata TaxID=8081 RepID=A0A3P9NAP6_POERE
SAGEEKQLFEKFWKGTFKAVATPRPESVIVASITARHVSEFMFIFHYYYLFPFRSPSHSLSPLRKKKKKKKKSSKKSKRHRYFLFIITVLLLWIYFILKVLFHANWGLSCCLFVCSQILSLKPGSELLNGKGAQDFSSHAEGTRDYDSGNDTSSPPSSKTGVSRASVAENQRTCCQRLTSPLEKQRCADRDNGSDSGNSVTSYASSCKPYREGGFSAAIFSGNSKRCTKAARCARRRSRSSRKRRKTLSSSTSRSRSSGTSRYSGRYSRSPSLSSCSRILPQVVLSVFTNLKHMHKVSGKRRRRKSYSPMRKRRRDSPSHLEARRITSARKRPIPYFRPSPSSSSRSTSVSSWSSLFTRSRSRSPIHSVSRSRSRSRSRSYSSYRSYSRSSSWNSIFGSRSRSRSRGSLKKRRKARR